MNVRFYRCALIACLVSACIVSFRTVAHAETGTGLPADMAAHVAACTGCHGERGEGVPNAYFPRLAGKPADYLTNQLVAFRLGRRRYAPMNYLLEFVPDPALRAMAAYFAAEPADPVPPVTPVVSHAVLAEGEALVTRGDAARGVIPCTACHGQALTGLQPAIPGLLGLKASYLTAQLGEWRYGTRVAKAPDCMQTIAANLTEDDATAIAAFLSSLPSSSAPPLARGTLVPPIPCGSEPS